MKIAICGCGIGGLATAIFAQRVGFEITLFDQFDTPNRLVQGWLFNLSVYVFWNNLARQMAHWPRAQKVFTCLVTMPSADARF
jgi:2-polyprenyl-6-methoxyphenol hydroxylase-like FAD-dependent oxidoreductase